MVSFVGRHFNKVKTIGVVGKVSEIAGLAIHQFAFLDREIPQVVHQYIAVTVEPFWMFGKRRAKENCFVTQRREIRQACFYAVEFIFRNMLNRESDRFSARPVRKIAASMLIVFGPFLTAGP